VLGRITLAETFGRFIIAVDGRIKLSLANGKGEGKL
jgi:hypothetical protein